MEIHRPSTTMRIPSRSSLDPRRPTASRTASTTSSLSNSSHTREPVPIPGTPIDEPPPPLPPPRCIEELDRGIDTAWSWSNSHLSGGFKKELAPIKPGSSLYGGYMHPHSDTRRSSDSDDMEVDDWDRRRSGGIAVRTPSTSHIFVGAGGSESHLLSGGIPSMIRRPPSPSLSSQRSVASYACDPFPAPHTTARLLTQLRTSPIFIGRHPNDMAAQLTCSAQIARREASGTEGL